MQKEKIINNLEKRFYFSPADLKRIVKDFHSEMLRGLQGKKSSLKMLPTYIDKPTGNEQGRFVALDLGGTNFRILDIELKGRGRLEKLSERRFVLGRKLINGTAEAMFGFIGRCIKGFIREEKSASQSERYNLGFTFSFPVKQTAVNSGRLIHWTKGFTVRGAVGKDVVALLDRALRKEGVNNVRINALVNDAVGTLACCSYKYRDCDAAVILGTGTNACYCENDGRDKMIINIEWGNFDKLKTTKYDRMLDENSENKGSQILEKMVSGMYLGEIVRLIVLDLARKKIMFRRGDYSVFASAAGFKTEYMSAVEKDNTPGLSKVNALLSGLGVKVTDFTDRALMKKICVLVSYRSAAITGAGIAATVIKTGLRKHTVAVDGSVYERYPGFAANVRGILRRIFAGKNYDIKLSLTKDGSGIGAAIIAAVAEGGLQKQ